MPLILRPATRADVPHLARWDLDPDVMAASSDALDGDDVYSCDAWADEIAAGDPASTYLIGELDGQPIGALLVIDPARERTHYWGAECPPGLRAIDIWIGEPGLRGNGHGTRMMQLAIDAAFAAPDVASIVIDPLASNTRAHRFYERLGFRFVARRLFGASDCFVYRLNRADWRKETAP